MISIPLAFAVLAVLVSHPGRTNSEGCHNNHQTGGYHCHGGSSSSGGSSAGSYAKSSGSSSREKASKRTKSRSPSKIPAIIEYRAAKPKLAKGLRVPIACRNWLTSKVDSELSEVCARELPARLVVARLDQYRVYGEWEWSVTIARWVYNPFSFPIVVRVYTGVDSVKGETIELPPHRWSKTGERTKTSDSDARPIVYTRKRDEIDALEKGINKPRQRLDWATARSAWALQIDEQNRRKKAQAEVEAEERRRVARVHQAEAKRKHDEQRRVEAVRRAAQEAEERYQTMKTASEQEVRRLYKAKVENERRLLMTPAKQYLRAGRLLITMGASGLAGGVLFVTMYVNTCKEIPLTPAGSRKDLFVRLKVYEVGMWTLGGVGLVAGTMGLIVYASGKWKKRKADAFRLSVGMNSIQLSGRF